MLFITLLIQLTSVFAFVTSDSWSLIENADFSFTNGKDSGARETKSIVSDYIKSFGVPLDAGQYGLIIAPGRPDMLDSITSTLKTSLTGYEPTPLVQAILQDSEGSRHGVVATTENDYTHALHGMFMLVINSIMQSTVFWPLVDSYIIEMRGAVEGVPALGAQRAARSNPSRYFLPDWLVSFPAKESILQDQEILSTVEFKMGHTGYGAVCDIQDSFFAGGGTAVAIWVPDSTGGVIHFIPVMEGQPVTASARQMARYDTMFDRILEAAATATWADTKLTLFAANSRYFAAGPARGYGLRYQRPNAILKNKRAEADDEQCPELETIEACSERKTAKIRAARKAFRESTALTAKNLHASVSAKATVNSKVIFLPSYGTKKRPATFLAHVLALTMDKLKNGPEEGDMDLDHSASASEDAALPHPSRKTAASAPASTPDSLPIEAHQQSAHKLDLEPNEKLSRRPSSKIGPTGVAHHPPLPSAKVATDT